MVAFAADYAPTTEAPERGNRARGIFFAVEVHAGENGARSRHRHREKAGLSYEIASGPTNFLNRDPIEEQGGLNLYGFVGNDPINTWDYLGLDFIAVGSRPAMISWQTLANHMSIEFFESCGGLEEGETFDWSNPPEHAIAEWEGAVELIADFETYEREETRTRRRPGPRSRGGGRGTRGERTVTVTVPISFIYFDREGGLEAVPDIATVLYAEDDAKERWEEIKQAARNYQYAEQRPEGSPLQNWPNSRYFLPWQGARHNSNTFAREMARVVSKNADISPRWHPGASSTSPLPPDPPTPEAKRASDL